MAIIENRVTEDGDVLIIKPEVPIVGLVSLYNFVDTTARESETDYFLKEFRYSVNGGLTFSVWQELTIENLQAVSISKEHQFVIEYRYTRVGDTSEIELEFENILVSGDSEKLPYTTYNNTYFKDFFEVNNINIYGWALNVLEKLYLHGILPEYMTRGFDKNDVLGDQDFISFWNASTHFFAIIVYFARQFRDIKEHEDLLVQFLENRDIEIGSLTTSDLLSIFQDYVAHIEKRGTYNIVDNKALGDSIDGELRRILNYSHPDELLLAHLRACETGWCVGKSSPVWHGTEHIINLNKGYEYTEKVEDLTKYPLINDSYISIIDDKIAIQNVASSTFSGIAYDGDETKLLLINKNLNYEISFFIEANNINSPITFGVEGFDEAGLSLNLLSADSGVTLNNFATQFTMLTDSLYHIRGIIYNQNFDKNIDTNLKSTIAPNITNLKFDLNTELKYIVPKIGIDNLAVASTDVYISNVRVRPLRTPFTRGILGIKNIIFVYTANNNLSTSQQNVENKIRSSLIPANSFLKVKYL